MGEDFQMLSAQEIEDLFTPDTEEKAEDTAADNQSTENKPEETTEDNSAEVDVDTLFEDSPESVGREENTRDGQGASTQEVSTSPAFYSSIVRALVKDGIFPDLKDEDVSNIKNADDFAELFNKQVESQLNDTYKRLNLILTGGGNVSAAAALEQELKTYNSISDEILNSETEEGENLRRGLLMRDYLDRGFSKDRATREVSKIFDAGTDLDDAKEALQSIKQLRVNQYRQMLAEAEDVKARVKEAQIKQLEFEDDDILNKKDAFKNLEVDKNTRQKVLQNMRKTVYVDPETKRGLSAVGKFAKENPYLINKYMALFYTLTNGFTDFSNAFKSQVNKEMNKGVKELEKVLRNSKTPDGSLSFVGLNDGNSKVSNWDFDV